MQRVRQMHDMQSLNVCSSSQPKNEMDDMKDYKQLTGLYPLCFQHPMDRGLLRTIKSVPGVPRLVEKVIDLVAKEIELEFYQGGAIEVSETTMPELHERFFSVCQTLNLPSPFPRLFVKPSVEINAFTTGKDRPIVCLNSIIANVCSDGEQRFIMGHEIGHCLCGHVVYHNVAKLLAKGLSFTKLLTDVVAAPLQLIRPWLMDWSRCSELSADRAGLLACQDMKIACSAFAKLAGHSYKVSSEDMDKTLLEQARGYRRTFGEYGLFRRLIKSFGYAFNATHPFLPLRYEWLKDWYENGYFNELLSANETELQQIAVELSDDPLMYDLKNAILYEIVDYFEGKHGVARSVSHPLLRKALFLKQTLNCTPLERLLLVELRVKKRNGGNMEYKLELTIATDDAETANRVSIDLGYAIRGDWAYAPKQFRHKMNADRTDEIICGIYSC